MNVMGGDRIEYDEERIRQAIYEIGLRHIICRIHGRRVMDSLTRATYYYHNALVCEAWNEKPQIKGCIFVEDKEHG